MWAGRNNPLTHTAAETWPVGVFAACLPPGGDGTKLYASCLTFYDRVPSDLAAKHEDLLGAVALKALCLLSKRPYLTSSQQVGAAAGGLAPKTRCKGRDNMRQHPTASTWQVTSSCRAAPQQQGRSQRERSVNTPLIRQDSCGNVKKRLGTARAPSSAVIFRTC